MDTLRRWATGRNILGLLILFLLMNLSILPAFYPRFQTLDTLFFYTPEQTYEYLTSYGEAGRQSYLVAELTLDLVYPLITSLFFSLLTIYAFQRGFPAAAWTHRLALLPFLVAIVDYVENACIVIMLLNYPGPLPLVARLAGIATAIKFSLTPVDLLFLVGLVAWLVRRVRRASPLSSAR